MAQKKGLGRGLSALIPDNDMELLRRVARGDDTAVTPAAPEAEAAVLVRSKKAGSATDLTAVDTTDGTTTDDSHEAPLPPELENGALVAPAGLAPLMVDIKSITPNRFQPRRQFSEDEMQNLAASIREHGILQPILLRETDVPGAYELVAGERRWRAAQRAELKQIPALIRILDDQQSLELAIIENVQRHDISAIDTAMAYQRLNREFHLSQEDIATRVGKSRSAVANTMRLLDLPEEVRRAIEDGVLSEGHGRAILSAAGDGARRAIFRRIMRDGLSVRDTERLSTKSRTVSSDEQASGAAVDAIDGEMPHTEAELRDLERHIEKALGLRVSIKPKGASGSVVIQYLTSEDLERLRVLLSKSA